MSRHIIVIIDGTDCSAARGADADFTNAFSVSIALAVPEGENLTNPTVLYFPGPGNRSIPGKKFNVATGIETEALVREAYLALCNNYSAARQDKLYIFGYSRGAVVAKALLRMIRVCGLISREKFYLIDHAYSFYLHGRRGDLTYLYQDQNRSFPVIEFAGLFDPVAGYKNHWMNVRIDTKVCKNIKHAVEILSLDERRRAFLPSEWRIDGDTDKFYNRGIRRSARKISNQKLQQIWIPGFHGDLADRATNSIVTDLAFLTMIERVVSTTDLVPNIDYVSGIYDRVVAGASQLCINEKKMIRFAERIVPRRNTVEIHPLYFWIVNKIIRKKSASLWREFSLLKKLNLFQDAPAKFFRPKNKSNTAFAGKYIFDLEGVVESKGKNAEAEIKLRIQARLSQIDIEYKRFSSTSWLGRGV